ncbi:MAG: hypothetical protein H6738_18585 [Alphaproteobacteria bacterium]|nr:hypothetical protein [Alphaproteobacteria bacterium]
MRALSLRRQGPGQAGSIGAEAEAARLTGEAARHEGRAEELRALKERVVTTRRAALAAMEAP